MNLFRIIIFCASCALAGAGAGFGAGIFFHARPAPAEPAQQPQPQAAGAGELDPVEKWEAEMNQKYPDIAHLKASAEQRAFLEKWAAAGYPAKNAGEAQVCLKRWSRNDPESALKFVHHAPDFPDRNNAYPAPLAQIGKTAISRVIAWMRENLSNAEPDKVPAAADAPVYIGTRGNLYGTDRNKVAGSVIFELCYYEQSGRPAAELAFADGFSVPGHAFGWILEALARVNAADALEMFSKVPDSKRDDASRGLVRAWVEKDFEAAVEWCAKQHGASYSTSINQVIVAHCAQHRPEEMPALVARLRVDLNDFPYNYSRAVNLTISRDLQAGFGLVKMMSPENRSYHAWELARKAFDSGSDQAVATAKELLRPAGQLADRLRNSGWERWVQSDRKAAEAWCDTLPDAALREQLKTMDMITAEPRAFLALAASRAPGTFSGRQIANALNALISEDGQSGVDAAKRWLLAHPEHITERSLEGGPKSMPLDYNFTLVEIGALPAGKSRDVVLSSVVERWLWARDWEQLTKAIPLYQDAAKQNALRFQVFTKMYLDGGSDGDSDGAREAARQWLAEQPLPGEVRASWEVLAKTGLRAPRTKTPADEWREGITRGQRISVLELIGDSQGGPGPVW